GRLPDDTCTRHQSQLLGALSTTRKSLILSGQSVHNSSSSHTDGRGARSARVLARQGPLNFTCASVTVRHFIRDTAEDCRSAVFAFATETVGDKPGYGLAISVGRASSRAVVAML